MKKQLIISALLILLCLSVYGTSATQGRNLLSGKLIGNALHSILVPRELWHPFPTVDERDAWNVIPEPLRAAYVQNAGKQLKTDWEPLPATVFLEYVRNGNRSNFERISFARRQKLATLVLGEVFENKGRFLDDIANGLWAICEESFWGVPAHMSLQRKGSGLPDISEPVVDLFAAETGSLLSWTAYLLGSRLDKVSPLIMERLYLEVDRRILTPNIERNDFWWMGFGERQNVNNWNPWINSNWLTAVLIMERDTVRREKAVQKIMTSLDKFLNIYPEDGGCDEGPGYWGRAGASLFDCLELLNGATKGAIDIYGVPLIRNIGQYICKVYIKDDYFINFADASGKISPEAGLIYRYGKRINDPIMIGFGAFLARRQEFGNAAKVERTGSLGRLLPDLFLMRELPTAKPVEPLLRDFWLPGLQVMGARSQADSPKGFYIAAKGGHNAESHNHNDVGNFVVYFDGKPVLVDAGVETYTAKTFSSKRYEIWTMQSGYHNLVAINGLMQKDGRQFEARNVIYNADDSRAVFSLDIAKAYPPDANVDSWQRTLTLIRGKGLELTEKYSLKAFIRPFEVSLITPLLADTSVPGAVLLPGAGGNSAANLILSYDRGLFKASSEEVKLTDGRLRSVWGEKLFRIMLTSTSNALQGRYTLTMELRP